MGSSFLSIINLTIICGISLMIQIVYWYGVFNRLKNRIATDADEKIQPSVCILICSKNGAYNLENLLPLLLKQSYPNFTILIANDHSSDNTEALLKDYQREHHTIRYFNVTIDRPGKKQALVEAIDYIDAEWILFTDVDCRPSSSQWVEEMIGSGTSQNKSITLGYSPYLTDKSLLSKWIAFENWIVGLFYLSFAIIGKPYMGVGRNMAIHKYLYRKEHLESHMHLNSGDDDLTLQALFEKDNYTISLSRTSFTWTNPAPTFKAYANQKHRHYSTAGSYPSEIKYALSVFPFSQIVFYISAILLLFKFTLVGAYFIIIRWALIYPIQRRLQRILELNLGSIWFLFFDVLLAVYYSIFSVSFILPKSKKWS